MSGLHRPVAINIDYANFTDLDLSIQCLPGPLLNRSQAEQLCRKLTRLFENQGAKVESRTSLARPLDIDSKEREAPATSALNLQLKARLIHKEGFWWFTTDYSFAQEINIYDETGFLLIRESFTGRFAWRLGFSSDSDEEFSQDYYTQLSQLMLNAQMRRRVLREARSKSR